MTVSHFSFFGFIGSLLLASLCDLVQLPPELAPFRPSFVVLILIYWLMFVPAHVGVCTAWLVGLWVDALRGDVLGVHAMAFAVMSYVVFLLYQRLRVFPLLQQAVIIAVLVALQILITRTLLNVMGRSVSESWYDYWPVFSSAVIWPWCMRVLHRWRRV
jgi:rod shape-determining protein MreD